MTVTKDNHLEQTNSAAAEFCFDCGDEREPHACQNGVGQHLCAVEDRVGAFVPFALATQVEAALQLLAHQRHGGAFLFAELRVKETDDQRAMQVQCVQRLVASDGGNFADAVAASEVDIGDGLQSLEVFFQNGKANAEQQAVLDL